MLYNMHIQIHQLSHQVGYNDKNRYRLRAEHRRKVYEFLYMLGDVDVSVYLWKDYIN